MIDKSNAFANDPEYECRKVLGDELLHFPFQIKQKVVIQMHSAKIENYTSDQREVADRLTNQRYRKISDGKMAVQNLKLTKFNTHKQRNTQILKIIN